MRITITYVAIVSFFSSKGALSDEAVTAIYLELFQELPELVSVYLTYMHFIILSQTAQMK